MTINLTGASENALQPRWTPEQDARLKAMWAAKYTGAVIAAALGKSRHAVLGRAHRLGLMARESPVSKHGEKRAQKVRNPRRRGPLARSQIIAHRTEIGEQSEIGAQAESGQVLGQPIGCHKRPTSEPSAKPAIAPAHRLPAGGCRFIAGEPLASEDCFCNLPRRPASPYCEVHHARCYQRVESGEDAA